MKSVLSSLANLFTHCLFLFLFLTRARARACTSRSINVAGPYLFPPFSGYIPCSRSCSLLRLHFLSSWSSQSFFVPFAVPTCWWTFPPFHLLICAPFSSVRCAFSFCRYLCRLARLLGTTVSFSLAICSPLFNVGR